MKKIVVIFFALLSTFYFLLSTHQAFAASKIIFFYGKECPHCQKEEQFLDQFEKDHPEIKIERFEVWHNKANQKFFETESKKYGNDRLAVPLTIINGQSIIGFDSAETTGQEILKKLGIEGLDSKDGKDKESKDGLIKVPILGEVNPKKISLPTLTIILGLVDGFNPCAMWALVALLAFLIGLNSKTKVLTIGGVFILTSYLASFLYMSAWLKAFLLLRYVATVQYLVAIISLVIGIVYLKDFIKNKQECEVVDFSKRKKIFQRMKEIGSTQFWLTALVGTIILALTVNIVEFVCSVGLPVVYTQVLAEQNIAGLGKYLYIAFYNLFYMLDDFIVFLVAVLSARVIGLSGVYSRWSRLIGAAILFILSFWLFFSLLN